MFQNYLKIAWRNLLRAKVFFILNITGLTIGMTAGFLIFLYVHFELSYDTFHTKADRIYRLVTDVKTLSETLQTPNTSAPMAINLKANFPEVEQIARIIPTSLLLRRGDVKFQEDKSLFADSTLFSLFDFPLIHGNPNEALREPFSIVLSQSAAKKYFGKINPVGHSIILSAGNFNATVTGIMKDMPENSHIKADLIVSMATTKSFGNPAMDQQWSTLGITSYLLLKPGSNSKSLEAKFPAFLESHAKTEMQQNNTQFSLFAEPFREVYLKSKRGGLETGSLTNVYIFSIIAAFILLIACINFVNLSTARSAERAKEVGIKKVIGAERFQLTLQFLLESVLVCLIAFVLSLSLSTLLLPLFNQLSGKVISTSIFSQPAQVITMLIIAVGIGILAGIYPAMVLSSFMPITVLKGRFVSSPKGLILRKGLVVGQFTISIALIAATIIVYSQLHYMRNQDLGFRNDQIMVIDTHWDGNRFAFQKATAALPNVVSASLSSDIPGGESSSEYIQVESNSGEMQSATLDMYLADFDFIRQYGMKLVAGRSLASDFGTDSSKAMILNESAVLMFGYASPQEAIGKSFSRAGNHGKIVGVVKDFHFRSLQQNIKPLGIAVEPDAWRYVSVKVNASHLPATIASIEDKWKKIIPNRPFDYYFADAFFDRQYRSDQRFGSLFLNFAMLTIFISCLGLLGLASYSTLQRTKEIGVRKVLGASVASIASLLSKDFLKLVLIAFVIASPLSWYAMHQWLEGFAYRISISWWVFVLAGSSAVMIAFVTISFQAIKAATSNPVKSLRTE